MTKLSTIPQHQLSITCGLCKHHTLLEVANLIAVVGGDTTAHEVRQRARCHNCGVKGNNTYQIVYTGNSDVAMDGAGVSAIIIIIVVASGIETGAGLDRAIDALSLLFVIGVAVGHALGAKDGENKITRFGDGCVRGGWLGFLVGVSLIAGTDFAARMDFSMIMPAMAVALLAPLYGYFFKIITMQLE